VPWVCAMPDAPMCSSLKNPALAPFTSREKRPLTSGAARGSDDCVEAPSGMANVASNVSTALIAVDRRSDTSRSFARLAGSGAICSASWPEKSLATLLFRQRGSAHAQDAESTSRHARRSRAPGAPGSRPRMPGDVGPAAALTALPVHDALAYGLSCSRPAVAAEGSAHVRAMHFRDLGQFSNSCRRASVAFAVS
jgi:hypothetical protein